MKINDLELSRRMVVANEAVQRASSVGLSLWSDRQRLEVQEKAANDFVSEADTTMEQVLRRHISDSFPDDNIIGEELGGDAADAFWSIDPIDGTANFLRGSPLWGISIAYVEHGETMLGVIALPALKLVLSAERDGELSCNDELVPVRSDSKIRVVAVGDNAYWPDGGLARLESLVRESGWGVASYRCASVGLAFAALGYTDGYLEKWTNLWDIAAGRLLCAKAGLVVRSGEEDSEVSSASWIQAASPDLIDDLQELWPSI